MAKKGRGGRGRIGGGHRRALEAIGEDLVEEEVLAGIDITEQEEREDNVVFKVMYFKLKQIVYYKFKHQQVKQNNKLKETFNI